MVDHEKRVLKGREPDPDGRTIDNSVHGLVELFVPVEYEVEHNALECFLGECNGYVLRIERGEPDVQITRIDGRGQEDLQRNEGSSQKERQEDELLGLGLEAVLPVEDPEPHTAGDGGNSQIEQIGQHFRVEPDEMNSPAGCGNRYDSIAATPGAWQTSPDRRENRYARGPVADRQNQPFHRSGTRSRRTANEHRS